jgi:hypothetical protein
MIRQLFGLAVIGGLSVIGGRSINVHILEAALSQRTAGIEGLCQEKSLFWSFSRIEYI